MYLFTLTGARIGLFHAAGMQLVGRFPFARVRLVVVFPSIRIIIAQVSEIR